MASRRTGPAAWTARHLGRAFCSSATSSAVSGGTRCWSACRSCASAMTRRSWSSTARTSRAGWESRRRRPGRCSPGAWTRSRSATTPITGARSTRIWTPSPGSCVRPTSCASSPVTGRAWWSVTGSVWAWSTSAATCICRRAAARSRRSRPRWESSAATSITSSWTCTPRRRRRRSRSAGCSTGA